MENLFFDINKLKYLGKGSIIGKTVRIRKPEHCYIGDNVIIDDFTYISCSMYIDDNCHISSHCSISGGKGYFHMGKNSTLSSHVSIHTCSSDYTKISMDLPSIPEELQFGGEVGKVILGDNITIGSHSVILPNVTLPNGVACGAFSLLDNKIYKTNSLYIGIPSKYYLDRNIEDYNKWLKLNT